VYDIREFPGAGMLIRADKGWFLARAANGAATLDPAGKADTGRVNGVFEFPGAGMLIWAEKGLFLARVANGAATVEPAGKADTGRVYECSSSRGRGC